jgi:acyl-CoA thioester hydrolase
MHPIPSHDAGATIGPDHPLRSFPVVTTLPVLWGDQDAIGHVNNVTYFRWYETARADLLMRVGMAVRSGDSPLGPILAHVACDFRRQLHFPDTVDVGTRVSKLGHASITVEHAVYSRTLRAIAAEGTSVMVLFNYQTNRPERMNAQLRRGLEELRAAAG